MSENKTWGSYSIPEENLGKLQETIKKLGRRASRIGSPLVAMLITGTEVKDTRSDHEREVGKAPRYIKFYQVEIVGPTPAIAGWTFVATIQHTDEGNILREVPGNNIPAKYREVAPVCEHCGYNRRRNDTFVLQNDDSDDTKQVGRNCLGLFLGGIDPHQVATLAEHIMAATSMADACESYGEYFSGSNYIDLEHVLQLAAQSVLDNGWTSRKVAREYDKTATADYVSASLGAERSKERTREMEKAIIHPTERAIALAEEAFAWVTEELAPKEEKSNYEHNLGVVCANPAITWRELGLAVSAVGVFYRNTAEAAERQARNSQRLNEFVGVVGKRLQGLRLTVISERAISGAYGTTMLYTMRDDQGRTFKWFASREELAQGSTYEMDGSVKKHEEWQGQCQTILTRCKVSKVG